MGGIPEFHDLCIDPSSVQEEEEKGEVAIIIANSLAYDAGAQDICMEQAQANLVQGFEGEPVRARVRVLQAGVLMGTGDEAIEKPEPAGSITGSSCTLLSSAGAAKRGPGSGSMVVCSGTTGASGATTTGHELSDGRDVSSMFSPLLHLRERTLVLTV